MSEDWDKIADDPEEWGEPVKPSKSQKRRLSSVVSVRFSPDEISLLLSYCQQTGDTMSSLMRKLALKEAMPRPCVHIGPTIITTSSSATLNATWYLS